MRIAAERNVFPDLKRERCFFALRDYRDASCELAVGERTNIHTVDADGPADNLGAPDESSHDRAFAGPVGARESSEPARLRTKTHAVYCVLLRSRITDYQISHFDHAARLSCAR